MSAAPTPGPWSFEAENGRAHPRVYGHNNSLIAEVGNAILVRWEEWDANARLIAAAPEMLAALRTVGTVLAQRPITKKDDELWAAFSQVVAAVTKAMGGTP